MTYEKQYQHICTMLHEYDLRTGSRGADGVIANPEKWIDRGEYFPFYASAAAMLIETRAKLDTKTTPRAVSTAVGRIIKNAPEHNDRFRGIFSRDGKFHVCDGYRLLCLNSDISSLPHAENDFDVDAIMWKGRTDGEPLPLPSIAEIRAFIAADKAKQDRRNYRPTPYRLGEFVLCNPVYLIDMLQALPGCTAYKPETPISPIYFKAENGDGVLLPVHPPKKDETAA